MKQIFTLLLVLITLSPFEVISQENICKSADSLFAGQDYFTALDRYKQCYDQDTSNKKSFLSVATCLYLLGDYQQAKEYYHKLEKDQEYANEANMKLAVIYESQQNLPKAIKYNTALTKKFPNNPSYLRKLGALYHQGNEPTQAIQSYLSALSLNHRDLLSKQGLAEIMLDLDELNTADSLIISGLNSDSTHIGLSLLHARVKYRLRD